MNFLNLFPVPLYRFDHQLLDNERDDIVNLFLNIEKFDQTRITDKYPAGSYTSFHSKESILERDQLKTIKSFIETSVNQAHYSIGLSGDLFFTKSWFSINRKYSFHEQHHHCPNIWSGVYYLKAEHDDATISFVNKHLIDTGWPYQANKTINTDYNSNQTVCRVQTGMLLIFPSYLYHKVDQHMTENERINIAFNMDIE